MMEHDELAAALPLESCTSLVVFGNQIALRVLEYLSIASHPPHGLTNVAVVFIEISRALLTIKAGLTACRTSSQTDSLPKYVSQDLRNRLQNARTTFQAWDMIVNKNIISEKKKTFGKFGKGFRMMFADSEIDKMRVSFEHCRASLSVTALLLTSKLGSYTVDASDAIGYVALANVLQCPDPTQPKIQSGRPSPIQVSSTETIVPMPLTTPPPSIPLPPLPSSSFSANPTPRLSSRSTSQLAQPLFPAESHRQMQTRDAEPSEASPVRGASSTVSYDQDSATRLTEDNVADNESLLTYGSYLSMNQNMRSPASEHSGQISSRATRVDISTLSQAREVPIRAASRLVRRSPSASVPPPHRMVDSAIELSRGEERESTASNATDRGLLFDAVINEDIEAIRLLLSRGTSAKDVSSWNDSTPLYTATKNGSLNAAEVLLQHGADPNADSGLQGESAFVLALRENNINFLRLFMQYGGDANNMLTNGETPFTLAMNQSNSIDIVELLTTHHGNPNSKNSHGETPLFKAIAAKREDLVLSLLQHGADPNLPGPKIMLWPAVHQSAILEALLKNGAKVERAPGVLELATSINSPEAVELLLRYRTDPNVKKDGIYTPLCSAIRDDHIDLVEVLLKAGADPNLPALDYPIFKAITYHREHMLPLLVAAGADLHHPKGAVESAVAHDNKDALRFLLENGVDVNARNTSGHTALTTAIKANDLEMVDLLLLHGADPSVRGHDWPIRLAIKHPKILERILPHIEKENVLKGVLEVAVVANQLDSVKLLLAKGVSIEEKNGGVFSPLTTSIRENRKDIFLYLLNIADPPADVNAPGEHLPVVKAIRRHREEDLSYIKELLAHGADVNKLYCGWNAVLQALDNGDLRILKLLAEATGGIDFDVGDSSGRTVREILIEGKLTEEAAILGLQK